MKIILDNEEEKKEFLRMCMYIHDFSVFFRRTTFQLSYVDIVKSFDGSIPSEKITNFKKVAGISLDLDEFPHLNILAGLYDCEEELKEEVHNRYIEVLGKESIEDEFLRNSIKKGN